MHLYSYTSPSRQLSGAGLDHMKIFGISVKKIPFYDDTHERTLLLTSHSLKEAVRTASVAVLLLLAMSLDATVQYASDSFLYQRLLKGGGSVGGPSFDTLQSVLPTGLRVSKSLCDVFLLILIAQWLVFTVLVNPKQKIPLQGLTVIRRFCFIQSMSYAFRALTLPFTLTLGLDTEAGIASLSKSGPAHWIMVLLGLSPPLVDSSFSVTACLATNLAFFLMAYSWHAAIKSVGLLNALIVLVLLCLCKYNYSVSIGLGMIASAFTFGSYHLLVLVLCQSKIFLGVTDKASMGFDLFFLNGVFCRGATRCIEWVDGLDLRKLQPFVSRPDLDCRDQSLLENAKISVP
jgi:hypothetical protein